MIRRSLILALVFVGPAWLLAPCIVVAQTFTGSSIELRDEGVPQGRAQIIDVVGTGGSVSVSGRIATLTLTGGGGGGVPSTRQILTSAPLTGGGDLTADRTISFASQSANLVLAAPNGVAGVPTFRALVDADIPNSITIDLAGTASALAADPTDCGVNQFANAIGANGNLGCTQPSFSNLSGAATDAQVPDTITLTNLTQVTNRAISDTTGTLAVGRGGTGQTSIAANQVYLGTAADTMAAKTLPSCSNGTTSKLLYDNTTQTFSCGTDQSGGGSLTVREVDGAPSVSTVSTVEFDQAAGFTVTDQGSGVARVGFSGGGSGLSHQQVMSRVTLGF